MVDLFRLRENAGVRGRTGMSWFFLRPSREASSLALGLLSAMQAVFGLAVLVLLFRAEPNQTLLMICGGLFVLASILFFLTYRPVSLLKDTMSWARSRHAKPEYMNYSLIRREAIDKRFGTNTPPDIDAIREEKSLSANNWVPNRDRSRMPRPRGD